MNKPGDAFQQATRYMRGSLPGGGLDMANRPRSFKEYPDAPRIALPGIKDPGGPSLSSILLQRKSIRRFSPEPISLDDLGYLVWATAGLREVSRGHAFRTAPSAGALYPIETYLAINRAQDLEPGLYHYFPLAHALEKLHQGDLSREVTAAALDQRMCLSAGVVFLFSAVFGRSKWKYRQRAYRYIYLDAGHMAQNLALAAVGLGLGSCHIGAIYDDELDRILGVDGKEESGIYMTVVGHPA